MKTSVVGKRQLSADLQALRGDTVSELNFCEPKAAHFDVGEDEADAIDAPQRGTGQPDALAAKRLPS